MCMFLSVVVTQTGNVLSEPMIDSHETLIKLFKLHERPDAPPEAQKFVRVEFTPPTDDEERPDYFAFDKYKLRVDERVTPAWWTPDFEAKVKDELLATLKRMLLTDASRPILIGGAWLLGEGAKVQQILGGRILAAHKKANLSRAYLSRAYLSGAYLSRAYLGGADLSGADLSGARRSDNPPPGWQINKDGLLERIPVAAPAANPA